MVDPIIHGRALPEEDESAALRRMAAAAEAFVARHALVAPLARDELETLAASLRDEEGLPAHRLPWLMIFLNNALWKDEVASVPFGRRMLLLPRCLRDPLRCPAETDEFGLLCENCGACVLGGLQERAEALGMMCLVAEGSTAVAGLIEGGEVDAIIGLGCLEALEKAFGPMVRHAVPGLAFPLQGGKCVDTAVDASLLMEALARTHERPRVAPNLKALAEELRGWFDGAALDAFLGPAPTESDRLARAWLAEGGKRHRPLLLAAAAWSGGRELVEETAVRSLALAVECFHKASLVHDDIEDGDLERDGRPSLNGRHGLAVALNLGDLLLGEGYRLVGAAGLPGEVTAELLAEAARCHLELCRGQGEELLAREAGRVLAPEESLAIFRRKTAPAFALPLLFAAALRRWDGETVEILRRYSLALGEAYQIRDDLDDERAPVTVLGTRAEAIALYEDRRREVLASLRPLRNAPLKRLLLRIACRALRDLPDGPFPR